MSAGVSGSGNGCGCFSWLGWGEDSNYGIDRSDYDEDSYDAKLAEEEEKKRVEQEITTASGETIDPKDGMGTLDQGSLPGVPLEPHQGESHQRPDSQPTTPSVIDPFRVEISRPPSPVPPVSFGDKEKHPSLGSLGRSSSDGAKGLKDGSLESQNSNGLDLKAIAKELKAQRYHARMQDFRERCQLPPDSDEALASVDSSPAGSLHASPAGSRRSSLKLNVQSGDRLPSPLAFQRQNPSDPDSLPTTPLRKFWDPTLTGSPPSEASTPPKPQVP